MAATKTAKTLLTSQALAAATPINAAEWNASTSYGGVIAIKITNGAAAPTTAPVVTFFIGEATGVKRKYYSVAGDTVNSSVNDFICEVPQGAMFVNATITNGATNAITVEAFAQELTLV
jgi:hypothetical protein